ncbi:MAG TPA: aspartate aminotransferase family protein [Vicinamibacteria bacterium]|nr:aspartate aminotransferase family protein [Vicinamibacteria bacterium]
MTSTERVPLVRVKPPGPESRRLMERERRVLAHGAYGDWDKRYFIAARAQGSLIEDVDGNRYIDFGAGWGTNNVGNCHPEVVAAVEAALREQGVACWTSAANSWQRIELAEKLLEVCPKRIDRVVFLTTGTEADEAALRIMRRASGRPIVLTFYGQYFGLSYSGQAVGSLDSEMRSDVIPFVSGYVYAPYPNPYRSPLVSRTGGGVGRATIEYIEDVLLAHEVPANRVAGVIVEPVIGEGGILVPPDDFLPGLRELCDRHGWYLCIDEVLSGFGRCGKMWAYEHWPVEPDIIVIGKGISGGSMPIAAVAARADITERADAYVASTYSGHPAACMAGLKTLEILQRDRLFEHATALGGRALSRLRAMQAKYPAIGDVRGKGLWLAVEFVKDRTTREKDHAFAAEVNRHCLENGLYLVHDSISWFVRIQPPVNIPEALLDQGLDILEDAIRAASGG